MAVARVGDAEARFRTAFEKSAIGMTITGLDARFLRVNEAYARLVGRTVEEMTGAPVRDVSHPDEWEADRKLVAELVANPGGIVQREKRYVRPDGTEVLAHLSVSAVAGPDGAAQYLISQMVDITQQREAERALAESEQRFRTLRGRLAGGHLLARLQGPDPLRQRPPPRDLRHGPGRGRRLAVARARRPGQPHAAAQVAESVAAGGGRVALDIKLTPEAGARWVRIHVATAPSRPAAAAGSSARSTTSAPRSRRATSSPCARPSTACSPSTPATASRATTSRAATSTSRPRASRCSATSRRSCWAETPARWASSTRTTPAPSARSRLRSSMASARPRPRAWRVMRPDGSVRWVETADPRRAGRPRQPVPGRRRHPRRVRAQGGRDAPRPSGAARRADRPAEPGAVPRPPRARAPARRAPPRRRRGPVRRPRPLQAHQRLLRPRRRRPPAVRRRRAPAHALRPADTIARFGGDEFTVLCEDLDGEAGARAVAAAHRRAVRGAVRRRGRRGVPAGERRHRARAADGADARGPHPRRRRRDVPREGARPRARRGLRRGDAARRARAASRPRARCAARSSATSCASTSSRSSASATSASRPSRRSSAGSTPSAGSCRPASSSRSPRRPA